MKTFSLRNQPQVRLLGRFDPDQPGFPMMWTGACAQMRIQATVLDVRIQCAYRTLRPYLSFEVDGLRAQVFAPLQGTHWYTVFLGMDAAKVHNVRITLETQAFAGDPASFVALLDARTDGALMPLAPRRRRIEFIGDSITSGEGVRGPRSFMEWLPMCFGASDNYTRLTAEKLHADYHVVSQSGWGVLCGWNNDPRTALPAVYDSVCGPAAMEASPGDAHGGEKPYAFDFDPDTIVVNLGTNDSNALTQPAFSVPGTGETFRFTQADIPTFEDACLRFLLHLRQKNPHARILWAYGIAGDTLAAPIAAAVRRAAGQGVPVEFLALPNTDSIRGGMGSREHPGPAAHRRMAALLAARLR